VAVAAAPALFTAYLLISRQVGVNTDAAAIAAQARDMLDGNVLLSGWTVTDVSFYTNELPLFMLVELVYGFHGDTTHALAALVFTLLVLVVAAAAKGRATGREAALRVVVAVAIVGVPALGHAAVTQLSGPDHTGTAVPLLVTWLVLERARHRQELPLVIAGLLAWAQIADPLVMYIGVLPLMLVCAARTLRDRSWRGLDVRLALAGVGSVVLAQVTLILIRAAGGFGAHAAEAKLAESEQLRENLSLGIKVVAVNYGAYPADRHGAADTLMSLVHVVGLLAAAAALLVVLVQGLLRRRGEPGDRLAEVAAVGILVNLGAFVVSALPIDLYSARQVVVVLPLGAVLAGRVWGPRLASLSLSPRGRAVIPTTAVVLALLAAELVGHAAGKREPAHGEDVAAWLEARGLRYGIGEWWNSSNITLLTGGRVAVRPVVAGGTVAAYRWLSKEDWYDADKYDATFFVVDNQLPGAQGEATAIATFGPPVERREFARAVVLVYDRDLLVGLPAFCVPEMVPHISDCPEHGVALF